MVNHVFYLLLKVFPIVLSLSCKDMNNLDIPWFSIIKVPDAVTPTDGLEFMYLDPKNLSPTIQPVLINDPNAISYTLLQVNNKSISSFLFK